MRKELDEQLCAKYPLIFRDRHADPSKTCMYWGIAVGDGWYNIVDALCANIQGHINNRLESIKWTEKWNANVNNPDYEWIAIVERKERPVPEPVEQVVATQVKEKFGGLRFYYSGGDDYIDGVVAMAESMSYRTCEVCGAPGTSTSGGWIRTLCEEHKNGS
jgi:hypothetical protein